MPNAPTQPGQPGIYELLGRFAHGDDGWEAHQEAAARAAVVAHQHADELARLELVRTRIEVAQAAAIAVLIVLAGVVALVLAVIITAKVAAL